MKGTSQIRAGIATGALALGLLAAAGPAAAADATTPSYKGYQPQRTGPNDNDYHANSNDNDYHANYHADYSVTQDGRPAPTPGQTPEDTRDPRLDSRRFQDGDRFMRSPYGRRR
jgi:hypothetical protein